MAWSPDGKRLATASDDQTAKVWDAASGQELLTLSGHSGGVYSVAWSPDGKRLATASDDQTAKVWDAASGQEVLTLKATAAYVNSVAWSPDGKRLATASDGRDGEGVGRGQRPGSADPEAATQRCVQRGLEPGRQAAGHRLCGDGTVQIYAIDIQQLLNLARSRVTRDLTPDECKRYFQTETCPPLP